MSFDILKNTFHLKGEDAQVVYAETTLVFPMVVETRTIFTRYCRIRFWVCRVPEAICKSLLFSSKLLLLQGIMLIPFVGIFLFMGLTAARHGFSYSFPYFWELRKVNSNERRKIFYGHYGKWFWFGVSCYICEFIPIFSTLSITSNSVGCCLLQLDLQLDMKDK